MRPHRAVICCAALTALACDRALVTPETHGYVGPDGVPYVTPTVASPRVASLTLSGVPDTIRVGHVFELNVTALSEAGARIWQPTVEWTTTDPDVASIHDGTLRGNAIVVVARRGTATLTAKTGAATAFLTLTVSEELQPPGFIEIESIRMMEVLGSGGWFYAPLLRIKGPPGAALTGVQFTIPGFGSTGVCSSYRPIPAEKSLEVFPEIYGDYAVTFDHQGVRASARQVGAVLYMDYGRRIDVAMPVIEGGFPTTYTGGRIENPWLCGPPFSF